MMFFQVLCPVGADCHLRRAARRGDTPGLKCQKMVFITKKSISMTKKAFDDRKKK
jgi:hypothetical protein